MSSDPRRRLEWLAAVVLAWAAASVVLLSSVDLEQLLGRRGLVAVERLMGTVLTALATTMILTGIREFLNL